VEQKTKAIFDLLIQKQPDNRRGWKAERCQVIEILTAFGEMPVKGRKKHFLEKGLPAMASKAVTNLFT
jgi:hypothetical protein